MCASRENKKRAYESHVFIQFLYPAGRDSPPAAQTTGYINRGGDFAPCLFAPEYKDWQD